MSERNQAALDFLLTRRSRTAKTMTGPVPSRDEIKTLLTAAARVPDHGKLEPWRFVVINADRMSALAALVDDIGAAEGMADEVITKGRTQFSFATCAIAVISSPKPSVKVPEIEQVYSAGAVCLSLVNAGLAAGWAANWLSGWPSHHREFCAKGLGLADHEKVAGIIHLGTQSTPPPERPRPDMAAITTWHE